jgi:hypothetical protein
MAAVVESSIGVKPSPTIFDLQRGMIHYQVQAKDGLTDPAMLGHIHQCFLSDGI